MSYKTLRRVLIFWTLFIGLGAVGGGLAMLIDPVGEKTLMGGLLPGLQKLPFADALFKNLTFSGIALIIVNGATQLTAFGYIIKKHRLAAALGAGCGVVLMLWICIQFFIFPLNYMSTAYFIFGLLEALTGFFMCKKERQ